MKRRLAALAAVASVLAIAPAVTPSAAHAASWRSCSAPLSGVGNPDGYGFAVFTRLRARSPMNCASARYALSHVRGIYRRTGRVPRVFDDGYVTWYGRRSYGTTVQYTEYDSGTAFRVTIVLSGD